MNKYPKWMHHRIFRVVADCIDNGCTISSTEVVDKVLNTKPTGEDAKNINCAVNQQFGRWTAPTLLNKWGMKNLHRGEAKQAVWTPKISMEDLYELYEKYMGYHPVEYLNKEPNFEKCWQ
tara:strand:+ start:4560 stop:4919 length:360 start_codon:yes stop_codon:yes gene_type:complete